MLKKLKKYITPWNLFILIILLFAFVLRIYRIDELMGFHYDQGRDALIIWDLIKNHKFFLIGPVTGLEGIFLGPFYYYLIAPFYLIGGGSPTVPSMFLSFLVTISLYFLYKTGVEIGGKATGFIALVIGSFSNYFVFSNRWLSNPTPIYLTSILIFYLMVLIIKNKTTTRSNYWWYAIYLLVGVSLHFELASAIFYLPVLLILTYWQRKKLNVRDFIISTFLLFITFLPQIVFNFRHENILLKNFIIEFSKFNPRGGTICRIVTDRLKTFWNMFYIKVFPNNEFLAIIFSIISIFGINKFIRIKLNKEIGKLFLIFLGIPAVGYILYKGNFGILYDYYFTGYYFILILLFSLGLSIFWRNKLGKILIIIFLTIFSFVNLKLVYSSFTSEVNHGNNIVLGNQLEAVTWIKEDSRQFETFNIDSYVPPVITYSYDYLFLWNNVIQEEKQVPILYTLYEDDPPHPERLKAWLERQKGIGIVEKEYKTGGITVQRRKRI